MDNNRQRIWHTALFVTLVVAGLAIDLGSKAWAFATLGMPRESGPYWLWPEVFCLETSLNEGALFGLGQGQVTVFVVLSVAALVGIAYWLFAAGAIGDRLMTFALGCVTAGTLGNLYDRLGLPDLTWNYSNTLHRVGEPVYAVRDWLHLCIMDGDELIFSWPIFNIADSLLVCGAALLLWHAYLSPTEKPAPETHSNAETA